MNRLKATLVAAAGFAVGVVTLRAVRARRRDPRKEAEAAAEEALQEASLAADHAVAALGHARIAGERAVEYARDEFEDARGDLELPRDELGPGADGKSPSGRARRLRRAGKGWIRR